MESEFAVVGKDRGTKPRTKIWFLRIFPGLLLKKNTSRSKTHSIPSKKSKLAYIRSSKFTLKNYKLG
ncbi:hypothetical protein DLM75_17885 [Leptospira stimsonii]|uniref:Uncharacterized protein n=1 Tax=Leptospira stimsonii TaxID=2202203 RepID=A0A396Z139_9LEPT|nr:hypothetical protein DLM75_17885 [Leptospira stimsonii]